MSEKQEVQHTPGTWIAVNADINDSDPNRWSVCVDGEAQYFIATIENGAPGDTLGTEEANARLIAAAPDLLEACKVALANMPQSYAMHTPLCLLQRAIKKAKGIPQ